MKEIHGFPENKSGGKSRQDSWLVVTAFGLSAVLLGGCGGTTTSTTTTTATTTTTTSTYTNTSTTTTMTYPGGCERTDTSELWAQSQKCFCFYTGDCLDIFHCNSDESLADCQNRLCGETPIDVNFVSTSFFNIEEHRDVLTIPGFFFIDAADLKRKCPDGGASSFAKMLDDGRRVFAQIYGAQPDWQCVHMPGHVGVEWLHIHSFQGSMPSESLPNWPPEASCAAGSMSTVDAARDILGRVWQTSEFLPAIV